MNINSLIRAARAVTQAEEADPLPTHGPLTDAIDALRKELTPRASILDALTISKPERRPVSVPKQRIERNDKYLRLVAARPCKFCGAVGQSQAAHEIKAEGLWPAGLEFPY